ncbi:hypothetical protein GCM10010435_46620 [Winogradskya consettensis]|uniref:Uncharacterized protein n=1 Tax=Winogradskya consettensis TaxID=113560 RepID=A0A919T1R0_9ACTN|nr:hypothetical protein Aco04nite_85000 [Actinoplanes consettensis]
MVWLSAHIIGRLGEELRNGVAIAQGLLDRRQIQGLPLAVGGAAAAGDNLEEAQAGDAPPAHYEEIPYATSPYPVACCATSSWFAGTSNGGASTVTSASGALTGSIRVNASRRCG